MALSSLQMVITWPAALFDPYTTIAALEEVVNVTRNREALILIFTFDLIVFS